MEKAKKNYVIQIFAVLFVFTTLIQAGLLIYMLFNPFTSIGIYLVLVLILLFLIEFIVLLWKAKKIGKEGDVRLRRNLDELKMEYYKAWLAQCVNKMHIRNQLSGNKIKKFKKSEKNVVLDKNN